MQYSILYFLFFFSCFQAFSQKVEKKIIENSKWGPYVGQENYFYLNSDTNEINHGKYTFISNVDNRIINEDFRVRRLVINGHYENGIKTKQWELKENSTIVHLEDITGFSELKLVYSLKGHEDRKRLKFENGVPVGKWEIKRSDIINNRYQAEKTLAFLNFSSGIATGEFAFEDFVENDLISIKGVLNQDGYFDKEVIITYKDDNKEIEERRLYDEGFLLQIEFFEKKRGELINKIEFPDVNEKLVLLNGATSNGSFKISDRGFGLAFDNGYQLNDPRWYNQQQGNKYLFQLFHKFDAILYEKDSSNIAPRFNLTRRFQYIYPDKDDSLILVLAPRLKRLNHEFQKFLESPKYILSKQKSDSLAFSYAFVNHAHEKLNLIKDVVDKIQTGYFDFLLRSNFYKKGVKGLTAPDTIFYTFNESKKSIIFNLGTYLNSHEDLLINLDKYLQKLEEETRKKISFSNKKIQYYQEQEKINYLDFKIVNYSKKVDSLFTNSIYKIDKKSSDNIPYRYKAYNAINNKILKDLNLSYVNEKDYTKKVNFGNELVCFLESFNDNYERFQIIERMPKIIDSTFTVYMSNPFDTRKMESKILGSVERAGMKLFYSYVEDLTKSPTCKDFIEKLKAIFSLKERLEYLANTTEEDVQRMDRALRRENVPARIERILGLQ
jgi:hypothetical protein